MYTALSDLRSNTLDSGGDPPVIDRGRRQAMDEWERLVEDGRAAENPREELTIWFRTRGGDWQRLTYTSRWALAGSRGLQIEEATTAAEISARLPGIVEAQVRYGATVVAHYPRSDPGVGPAARRDAGEPRA